MPKREKSSKKDDKIIFAFLATFLSIIGFVIALIAKKDDKYVMFYAKQSLVIFIVCAILGVAAKILLIIPIIGAIINFAVIIITFIIWLLSWIYALSGKEKLVPVVGEYARKFRF
ncbi:hypothetical protein FJZ19_05210 [Candidatus Pacearchaeota archaeon]|nr:hypothetical protein [Candidatus Pacearchaeota archaeon]